MKNFFKKTGFGYDEFLLLEAKIANVENKVYSLQKRVWELENPPVLMFVGNHVSLKILSLDFPLAIEGIVIAVRVGWDAEIFREYTIMRKDGVKSQFRESEIEVVKNHGPVIK